MRMAQGRQGHEQLAGGAHLVLATGEGPAAQRLSMKSGCGARGGEQQMLFERPSVACIRAEYAHMFTPGCTMLECMQQQDWHAYRHCHHGIGCFIMACLKVYLAKGNAVPTMTCLPVGMG
jgi:hypothetical protein